MERDVVTQSPVHWCASVPAVTLINTHLLGGISQKAVCSHQAADHHTSGCHWCLPSHQCSREKSPSSSEACSKHKALEALTLCFPQALLAQGAGTLTQGRTSSLPSQSQAAAL